jgi:hypothetical protein
MLNQLDVLIGFAVVMAVVSLLITLVTQMVSAALGLRGKYLAEALEAMIHKIDPTISEEISDLGRNLAGWILTHPVLSDSLLLARPRAWDDWPIVGWIRQRWKVASAIRSDELFKVLQDVAGTTPDKALHRFQQLAEVARKAWLGVKGGFQESRSSRGQLRNELTDIAKAKKQLEEDATQKAIAATDYANTLGPDAKAEAIEAVKSTNLAAQMAIRDRIQAEEIAKKAACAVEDENEARRFANEMSMRAAAAKVLARLYRPAPPPDSTAKSPVIDLSPLQELTNKIQPAK